ncbi:MAG: ferredoxin [Clostridiales bacterium 43-6]|nr:MAG: ferredoxin [Clostridiales bacterium 43-6]
MKGFVDKDTCIGCGVCPDVCPEIFFMDEEDKAQAKDTEIPEDVMDTAVEARDSCPVSAIDIH